MSALPKRRSALNITAMLLLGFGLGLTVFALLADWMDIGGGEGFGYQQMIVLIIGIVMVLGGLRIAFAPWINRLGTTRDTVES